MTNCKQCGGTGINSWENDSGEPGCAVCPCLTSRLEKLERVYQLAKASTWEERFEGPWGQKLMALLEEMEAEEFKLNRAALEESRD